MKTRTNEHVRAVIPGALKIRFAIFKRSLRAKIRVKDTQAMISVEIETGNAVWVSRHQEFSGEGAEPINNIIRDITNFLVEAYKEKWAAGAVTADMLKMAYQYEYQQSSLGMNKRESLLRAKERLLNDFETSMQNKPFRMKDKVSAFEKMLADVNQKLELTKTTDEIDRQVFSNRILVRKTRPEVDENFNRVVRHRINIRFVIRRQGMNKAGLCTIQCKLGVNGVYANRFSTGVKALPKNWDPKFQAIIGDEKATAKLISMKEGLEAVYQEFRSRGRKPEPEEVIAHYFDHELQFDKKWTMEALCDAKVKDLHRRGRTSRTIMKYRHIYTMFREAIPIVLVEDVKPTHIREFHEHLKNVKGYTQDYCNKCVCAVFGLFELAIANEAITHNPGKGLRLDWERKLNLTCLSDDEIKALKTTEWSERLQKVVDSFLFMCYTGLHIADYQKLRNENVHTYQGQKFIEYKRQKNDQPAMVPIGKEAKELIEKYGSVEQLPRISSQKQNDYLKVIAERIGTDKLLTNKVARKTFTDMSINHRGMSFEAVASMLGHASTDFVKVYGRVRENRIFAEWRG